MRKQTRTTLLIVLALCLLYSAQIVFTNAQTTSHLAILGFHHIALDHEAEEYFPDSMWVSKLSTFEAEMSYLYEQGYQTLTLDEVYAWRMEGKKLPEKSVVLTFDDGFLSSIKYAQPILERYGFQGSVFAIGSLISEHGPYDDAKRQHASLEDMKNSSLSFYSHTYDLHHKDGGFAVNLASEAELQADIEKSNTLVSGAYLAYPYGKYNEKIIKVLQQNQTKLAFGFHENRKASIDDDPYRLPRFCVNRYTTLASFQAMLES